MIETGISFGNIHSFYDLDLILSKAEILPATPKTNYIEIPGGDGTIDLTEAFGEVKYNDREGIFTFTMNPSSDLSVAAFEAKKTEVSNLLNGLKCNIILDKDADYYWTGRLTVSEYRSDRRLHQIVITAVLAPYKLKVQETVVDVELTGEEQEIVILNERKKATVEITCTESADITFKGQTWEGWNETASIPGALTMGENVFTVTGTGTITFVYQEGGL